MGTAPTNVPENAGQVAWYHLTSALLGLLLFCALPWDKIERIAPVLQWSAVLLVPTLCGVRLLSGLLYPHRPASWMPWPKPPTYIHLHHLRWCFRACVMLSSARSPSESDLLQLCWLQGSCLPVLAVPVPGSAVRHEQPDGFLQQLLINFVSQVIWFMSD